MSTKLYLTLAVSEFYESEGSRANKVVDITHPDMIRSDSLRVRNEYISNGLGIDSNSFESS